MTPQKKEEIINQVLRRARTASTPTNDRPKSPLRRNRFLSASISPSGRPPISPRSPVTSGSPLNHRASPVSSKILRPPITPKKTPKQVANLDESFIFDDRSKSSPPEKSSSLSDKTSESLSKHTSLVKSPTKENSTQTPREIETQTDPDISKSIVKTRIIKVPISAKSLAKENAFDLADIQKSVDELTSHQQETPISTSPAENLTSQEVSTSPKESSTNNVLANKPETSPIKDRIRDADGDDEKENIWNYFDKSIRVPNLDKTYVLGPDHILADNKEDISIDQFEIEGHNITSKMREKRILNEVNESVYHGNETFIIGEDSAKMPIVTSNVSNEKTDSVGDETSKTNDSSAENILHNSQQSIDTSACLFESMKPKEYSMNTILEETEKDESNDDNQTKREEISPRDITPFPSSIINLASLQPPTFTSIKKDTNPITKITETSSDQVEKKKSIENPQSCPPAGTNLSNQMSPSENEGHLSEESEGDESAESFKLEFSFDPSQESFSSRINETIEPSSGSSCASIIQLDAINLDDIDKMNDVELRKSLSMYQIKMPVLHNQKLIENFRNKLKDLTKKSRFGAIYSAELLNGFDKFPKGKEYQDVQQRLLDTNDISSKTRSASKKYYNYVLLDPRNVHIFLVCEINIEQKFERNYFERKKNSE